MLWLVGNEFSQLDALSAFNNYNYLFTVRVDGTGLTASVSLKFH